MDVGDSQVMLKQNRVANIIIDTNVLVYMYESKRDIFDFVNSVFPYSSFFVLDKTIDELEKIYNERPRKLVLIKNYLKKLQDLKKFEILETKPEILEKYKKVDRLLIYFSYKYIIYTNDKILKNKIKKRGNKVLTLRTHDVFLN